jgi:hypothetical protein
MDAMGFVNRNKKLIIAEAIISICTIAVCLSTDTWIFLLPGYLLMGATAFVIDELNFYPIKK